MDIVRAFLSRFVSLLKLPKRVITRDDGKPYLERWYLCGEAGGLKYFPGQPQMRWWQRYLTSLPCIYVHRFVSSDDDPELHNHPWEAVSLILAGGYVEERLCRWVGRDEWSKTSTYRRYFRPWSINRIFSDTFHKVTLVEEDCWTLIKCGSKVSTWGFLDVETDTFMHWKQHVALRAQRIADRLEAERAERNT